MKIYTVYESYPINNTENKCQMFTFDSYELVIDELKRFSKNFNNPTKARAFIDNIPNDIKIPVEYGFNNCYVMISETELNIDSSFNYSEVN